MSAYKQKTKGRLASLTTSDTDLQMASDVEQLAARHHCSVPALIARFEHASADSGIDSTIFMAQNL